MNVVFERVAGLDVHKESVVACVRMGAVAGRAGTSETRTFGTMTAELLALSDWLSELRVTHVAMESTGVYWKPIFNILDGQFEVMLVNAKHIKQVPGRKTDVTDSEWIAQLLQCGLLSPSFVPPKPIRQLRDLTRHRVQLVHEKTSVANRIHKVLEDANIKLSSVASDILGVSGRAMLQSIVAGETDPEVLAENARRVLRKKLPELRGALRGRIEEHHRFMLKMLLDHLAFLEASIGTMSKRIEEHIRPFVRKVELLSTIPGVKQTTAQNLIAEIGTEMSQFPSDKHLASWAGVCPGNNESAGKRKTGKTSRGSRWLRRALTEAAWAAKSTKGTYLSAQYRRLAPRRGKKRAIIAVAHTLLRIAYHVLKNDRPYEELGGDFFDRLDPQRLKNHFVRRLNSLGYEVTLAEAG